MPIDKTAREYPPGQKVRLKVWIFPMAAEPDAAAPEYPAYADVPRAQELSDAPGFHTGETTFEAAQESAEESAQWAAEQTVEEYHAKYPQALTPEHQTPLLKFKGKPGPEVWRALAADSKDYKLISDALKQAQESGDEEEIAKWQQRLNASEGTTYGLTYQELVAGLLPPGTEGVVESKFPTGVFEADTYAVAIDGVTYPLTELDFEPTQPQMSIKEGAKYLFK